MSETKGRSAVLDTILLARYFPIPIDLVLQTVVYRRTAGWLCCSNGRLSEMDGNLNLRLEAVDR